jgi:hypothetical protein
MELPHDVMCLIKEYAKPLKRRKVSKFWHKNSHHSLDVICGNFDGYVQRSLECDFFDNYNETTYFTLNICKEIMEIHIVVDSTFIGKLIIRDIHLWDGYSFKGGYPTFEKPDENTFYLSVGTGEMVQLLNDNDVVIRTL